MFTLMSSSVVEDEPVIVRQHEGEAVSNISEDDVADEHMYSKKPRILRQNSAMKLLLGSDYGRMQQTSVENTELQSQFLAFTNEAITSLDTDPLKWWQANCQRYRLMVPIVLAYLCVTATSVPSERVRILQ